MLMGLSTLLLPVGAFVGLILTITGLFPNPVGAEGHRVRRWERVILGVVLLGGITLIGWLLSRDRFVQ